jgi:hypothetical protein
VLLVIYWGIRDNKKGVLPISLMINNNVIIACILCPNNNIYK